MKKLMPLGAALLMMFNSAAQINFKQNPFPPSVLLSSVLENGLSMSPDVKIPTFDLATVVFLPTKNMDGSDVKYEGQKLIKCEVKQQGNVFYKEFLDPFSMNPVTGSLKRDDFGTPEFTGEPADGNYDFEISVEDKLIFSIPFHLIVIKNDDVYADRKEFRMVDGLWSDYAFYTFNKEGNMEFTYYTTDLSRKFPSSFNNSKSWEDEVQLFFEGKAISKPMKHTYSSILSKWYAQTCAFERPVHNNNNEFLQKEDLKDGHYTIKRKLNGALSEYPFEIKDGKMLMIPEQDRSKTSNPAKVFEGMNKEFWLKRK